MSQPNEEVLLLLPSGTTIPATVASRLQNGSVMVAVPDAAAHNLPPEIEAEAVVVYRIVAKPALILTSDKETAHVEAHAKSGNR